MAAVWQKWMPIYIQRLKSNPYVIAMHPSARAGYLWLFMEQWQSDDCTLPNSVKELRVLSCMGTEWDAHGEEILDRFTSLEGDRLRNDTCYELWMEARAKYEEGKKQYEFLREKRTKAGKIGNDKRWEGRRKEKVSQNVAPATDCDPRNVPDDRLTYTYTGTDTGTEEQLLLAPPPEEASAPVPFIDMPTNVTEEVFTVTEEMLQEWAALYPSVDVRQQVRNMRGWLDGNPDRRKTRRGMTRFIHNWLAEQQNKGGKYGAQPVSAGGSGPDSPATARVASGVNAFRRAAEQFGSGRALGADGADGGQISPPGHERGSPELPLRLRAPDGDIRAPVGKDGSAQLAN